jgi:biopolymer transport protein ExbB
MRFKLLHILFSFLRPVAALMCCIMALICTPALAQAPNAAVATQASPAAPAQAASPKKPAETLDNPYGIEALWKGSDLVARFVLVLLAIMSIGSWYIMVTKLLEQARTGKQAGTMSKLFWAAGSVRQGAGALEVSSPYRFIAESGAQAAANHTGLKAHIPVNEWVSMSIQAAVDRVQAKAQGGLAFLATVGSTSPFVGLFGTVWGIYHALTAIGISGQASIDKVAGPVGEALIMTAIGLAVAIPAVLGYNWLARRNKVVMDEVREFSEELNAVLVGSGGKAA